MKTEKEITIVSPKAKMTKREIEDVNLYNEGFQEGRAKTLAEVREKIEKLKEKIKSCGNLNYRLVDNEWDGGTRFERDLTNSAIVLEYIDELLSSLDEKENNIHLQAEVKPHTSGNKKGANNNEVKDEI